MSREDKSYIKYTRALHNNPIFKSLSYQYRHIFMTILINMAFEEIELNDHGEIVRLKPGQFMTTIRGLADLCDEEDIDRSKVERALKIFEKLGFSRQEKRHTKNIITITETSICRVINPQSEEKIETRFRKNTPKIETEIETRFSGLNIEESDACGDIIEKIETRFETRSRQDSQKIETQKKNNKNYKKTTTTPLPPKGDSVVVFLYPCFEEKTYESIVKDLSEENKKDLQKYPENRVKLALDYAKVTEPTTTLIRMLIWHCAREFPPIPNVQKLTDHQKFAFEINDYILSVGRKDLFDKNQKLIMEKGCLYLPRGGSEIPVVIKYMEDMRNDFKELKEIYGNKRKVG